LAADKLLGSSSSSLDEDVLLWPHDADNWRAAVPRARGVCPKPHWDDEMAASLASRLIGETVLVTGATGGLGRAVVQWLEDKVGVPALRLARRLPPGEDEKKYAIVGDLTDTEALLSNPVLKDRQISTIFHLAGSLKDATVARLDRESFSSPISPKARGLVALRRAAKTWGTKKIVAFSSTTSLFGFGGQTNYSAANSLLDAYADFDDAKPSVLSLHWGPWGEAGMAAEPKAMDFATRLGDLPLSTREALRCLGLALNGGSRFAAFKIQDWSKSPWRSLAVSN